MFRLRVKRRTIIASRLSCMRASIALSAPEGYHGLINKSIEGVIIFSFEIKSCQTLHCVSVLQMQTPDADKANLVPLHPTVMNASCFFKCNCAIYDFFLNTPNPT